MTRAFQLVTLMVDMLEVKAVVWLVDRLVIEMAASKVFQKAEYLVDL